MTALSVLLVLYVHATRQLRLRMVLSRTVYEETRDGRRERWRVVTMHVTGGMWFFLQSARSPYLRVCQCGLVSYSWDEELRTRSSLVVRDS